jgi:hypothetical protein
VRAATPKTLAIQEDSAMMNSVPALCGKTRLRSAPHIGLGRHRPWAAPRGANPERGALL